MSGLHSVTPGVETVPPSAQAAAVAVDEPRAVEAIREFLQAFGYEVAGTDALNNTPLRVVKAWRELLAGRQMVASEVLARDFDAAGFDDVVMLRNISFYSMCEHHLLPFHGVAHVAYIPRPGGRVVGLSKLARLVEMHARRLQLQERMTRDIASDLERELDPVGVAVVVQAVHLCMCARGVQKPGAEMRTSTLLGAFREKGPARAELFSMIGG